MDTVSQSCSAQAEVFIHTPAFSTKWKLSYILGHVGTFLLSPDDHPMYSILTIN